MTTSLEATEAASAAVAVAPRVKLADIEAAIAERYWLSGTPAAICADHVDPDKGLSEDYSEPTTPGEDRYRNLRVLTICLLVMKNGFTVIGKSSPASPENFNAELGRQYAYEDAVRQLWPLMGYALRDRLAAGAAS